MKKQTFGNIIVSLRKEKGINVNIILYKNDHL